MKLRPIKTEKDHRAALAEVEGMLDARPGTPAGDRLEILVTLVEAYEERHCPMPPPDPVEAIRYAMESRGITNDELASVLGNRQHVKEILGRKRTLTLGMIRRLHSALGISADVLIQPLEIKAAA